MKSHKTASFSSRRTNRDAKPANDQSKSEDLLDRMPTDLQKSLRDLRKHESRILGRLRSDPQLSMRFLSDPLSVLTELKIPLDSKLRERLKAVRLQPNFLAPRTFLLPNGKMITPRVRVSIVAGDETR